MRVRHELCSDLAARVGFRVHIDVETASAVTRQQIGREPACRRDRPHTTVAFDQGDDDGPVDALGALMDVRHMVPITPWVVRLPEIVPSLATVNSPVPFPEVMTAGTSCSPVKLSEAALALGVTKHHITMDAHRARWTWWMGVCVMCVMCFAFGRVRAHGFRGSA